ncbi:zinc finger protein Xfin isoform X2 [Tribolium madens]|uniref:zinc finger protein Xfin isoform X2 n=1 Tax=Tribolium madens TaxID=41895 RepID=UPI001CF73F65|nr:zinc finger protein Xfin isoform X2 [Tribolium madens]
MSVPSMVVQHRSGEALIVRSGDALFDDFDDEKDLPECKVKRNYSCASCDFFTQNPRHYLYHLRDVHEEKVRIYECPNCLYASKHFQKLLRHTKMVHGDKDDDDRADTPPPDDPETVFKCSVCAFSARTRAQLDRHERAEHIKTKFFKCTKCTYATHMKARFTKHVKYHSMPMIKCDMCDFRTPYKWNLDRHCKNHNGKGAFRCSACNFTADIKQSLTVHEMNHHVPPVGQAAGLGVGRRRNKVGASDATAAEEAARQEQVPPETEKKTKHSPEQGSFGPDFINPDDIIHHANGNVYIKNKCKLCNYKSAWASEMTRHEQKVHNINTDPKPNKKPTRPIPNLIPIPSKVKKEQEPEMTEQDINDICAKSANSALKDFASLFGSEDVFENCQTKIPDLIPTTKQTTTDEFKQKNASFFDKLKEKLMSSTNSMTCPLCGHKSKCLSEQIKHQKKCGKDNHTQTPSTFTSSSRCQYCRQRCKSSQGLYTHQLTCPEALKAADESENELRIDESQSEDGETNNNNKPHPMENRVFIWNNIEFPMDVEVDDSKYEYKVDDNVSLDLSVRTQSPGGSERSESSYVGQEFTTTHLHSPVADKIPTHGNDITVAQHKRVFKCPHCTFWASTASRFHVHIVGHLNKKPFECSLCAYRSNWRWDITKHIKLKSVRDPAHESAKVLMTDETGRRNYTKYNKYLTEIHVSGNQSLDTSGGSGTRPKHHDRNTSPSQNKGDLPKLTRAPSGNDFSPMLRPPPPLKAADGSFFKVDKNKRSNVDNKRTFFKCKKCNFRDVSREILLAHVKGHYPQGSGGGVSASSPSQDLSLRGSSPEKDEASVSTSAKGSQAPFRCGHCNQRHCRLKHSGDIRVVSNKNGQEKLEIEEQTDEPDHVDVPQDGAFKCNVCPFSSDSQEEFDEHLPGHSPTTESVFKCQFCNYFVNQKENLFDHLRLHGIGDPEDFLNKLYSSPEGDLGKRFKCMVCPYVTNSKSQYTYHKQFHKPRGGQYTCTQCSYNVSKRHLLHQHLKVHGISITPQKQNGDVIDLDDISDEIEEVSSGGFESQNFPDIPLVWVSKNDKFSKMFKCRYCPHVNLRKVNIQEHEKMHSVREKNPNSSRLNDVEHRCSECNYVCNNAGVLSSHSKVHQGLYGTVHCLVDQVKSDEEQIRELSKFLNTRPLETINLDDYENPESSGFGDPEEQDNTLYFCSECPARFLKENEFKIHTRLHGLRSYYKCDHCSYSARQKPHLLAHKNVHSQQYQDRTQVLQTMYKSSNQPPDLYSSMNTEGETIWLVSGCSSEIKDLEMDVESLSAILNKPPKSSLNVPLSGTELFLQKSEAQQKLKEPSPPSPKASDPQFGSLMHGNPNFVYPTYLKNGKMKEKRYKCHKCPSAFEKREQYKVHLNLHGSKQRYNCEYCDYSVKYYANYVQHLKKHKMNSEALAARGADDVEMEVDDEEVTIEASDKKLSLGDQQALNILQQRLLVNSASPKEEEKKAVTFNCPNCPYVNHRKDAVDNHQKRHVSVSGSKSNYTCEHCDYSVPQVHFLREHAKLHFVPNKGQVDGYMYCDSLKLVARKVEDEKEDVIFEEGVEEVTDKFNNNDGEKQFVNVDTGEVAEKGGSDKMDES